MDAETLHRESIVFDAHCDTLLAMLQDFTDENGFKANDEDEVFTGSCVTRGGQVVHERVKSLLG